MIPKKIHYFWFGKGEKTEMVNFCINSWKKNLPDFEIIEWNEANFDVNQIPFTQQAYEEKKWAFVSDYARAKILFEEGGFYLDTDMEVRLPLNEFIKHKAICGFEVSGTPFSAFWAVEKGHILSKKIKEYYENIDHFEEIPNTFIFSKMLEKDFGANPNKDEYQELKNDIVLYPSTYFSLDLPKNYIVHHFSGSWHGAWTQDDNSFKKMVNTYGILKLFSEIPEGKKNIKNVVYNHKIINVDKVLDQIPFSYIFNYVKKNLLKKIFRK